MSSPQEPPPAPGPLPPSSTTTLYRAGWRRRGPTQPRGGGRRTLRPRRILRLLLVLALAYVVFAGGLFLWAGGRLRHTEALAGHPDRPAAGQGTNWLLVGSDSRRKLTAEQRRELHVGGEAGLNTDTIMLLHYGASGPYLISLPRDSYVPVPGHGESKINAAYALGGPKLLTRTVEQATGLRVDHYAEVDFLGFVQVVDALGGVTLCLEAPLKDEKSGADLPAGCAEQNGTQALAYVRARYHDPEGDLGRVRRQRQLVNAVADGMLGPGVLLNPFAAVPVLNASLDAVRVDDGTGVIDLTRMGLAMKRVSGGGGAMTTVPVHPGAGAGGAGDVLVWDEAAARRLFQAVREDGPIPTSADN